MQQFSFIVLVAVMASLMPVQAQSILDTIRTPDKAVPTVIRCWRARGCRNSTPGTAGDRASGSEFRHLSRRWHSGRFGSRWHAEYSPRGLDTSW